MAKKSKKPVPMRSKRSGIKTAKRISKNHEVLKKLAN
jgi:hypothetical protein